jgi:protein-S-isoprenylcysteine O-methyltransferase Ste14
VIRIDNVVRDSWVAWVVVWLIAARIGRKKTLKSEGPGIFLRRSFPPIALLVAASLLLEWWQPGLLVRPMATPPHELLSTAGLCLLYLGFLVTFWARTTLGGNWSGRITIKENHELVNRGPYRFVRHPIYTGVLLALLGTALVFADLLWGLIFAALVWGFAIKARIEESYMREQFGSRYEEYRRHTGFLLPRLRSKS